MGKRIKKLLFVLFLSFSMVIPAISESVYSLDNSVFSLNKDNNSFGHHGGIGGGFEGYNWYYLRDPEYLYLRSIANDGEKAKIINNCQRAWNGSCHGIAMTMGLLKRGSINAFQLAGYEGEKHYYDLGKPKDNKWFLSKINMYQLSQNIKRFSVGQAAYGVSLNRNHITNGVFNDIDSKSNVVSLKDLLYSIRKFGYAAQLYGSEVSILSYNYFGKNDGKIQGHSILVVGTGENADGSYYVKLYDENNRNSFIYMTISKDYKSFEFTDGNSNVINQNNYVRMAYMLPMDLSNSMSATEVNESVSDYICFDTTDNIEIKTEDNKIFKSNEGEFSGSLVVDDFDFINYGESTEMILETSQHESYEINSLGEEMNVQIYDNNDYLSIEGEGIDTAKMDADGKIELEGSDYSFRVFSKVGDNSDDLVVEAGSISGKADGTVVVDVGDNNVKASSEKTITEIVVGNYRDTKSNLSSAEDSKEITVSTSSVINECGDTHYAFREPAYEWSADGSQCKASVGCSQCGTVFEEYGEISSETTKQATATSKGETTYTAVFKNNTGYGKFSTQVKTIADIPEQGGSGDGGGGGGAAAPETTEPTAEDKALVASVTDQINALPAEIGLDNLNQAKAAIDAYNALSEVQKSLVDAAVKTKIAAAEAKYKELTAPVDKVKEKLKAIPEDVTKATKAQVTEAREAYDALADQLKALISEADVYRLEKAEFLIGSTEAAAKKPTIKKAKAVKGKKANVSWKKVSGADGYQIAYSTSKKLTKKTKSVSAKAGDSKKTLKKLKAGKKYYVRVKAYTKVYDPDKKAEVKVYSKWSKTKSLKAKK